MKNFTLIFLSISFTFILIGQDNQTQMDDHGRCIRNFKSYDNIGYVKNIKEANEWFSLGPYGGDVHDIAINPLDVNTIIAAAGIPFISYDSGESWEWLEALSNLAPNGIETIEAASNGSIYAAGPSSSNKIYRSTDGGETWEQKTISVNSSGKDIAIDPIDPNVIYMGLSTPWGGTGNKVIVKSTDGGDSWTSFDLLSVLPVGWEVVNLVVDPDDSQVIFAIGSEGFSNGAVVATFDGGENWEVRTGNLPGGAPYNSLTIADQNVFLAGGQLFGSQYLGVYKTEDYGQNWSNISSSFPNQVSNDILIDPGVPDIMYVATEGDGIYYTTDGGDVWNFNATGAGSSGAARCLIFNADNTDIVYAGFLSLAVCKSTDAAQSWEFANKGIATLQTDDVEVNPNDPLNLLVGFEAENSGGCYITEDSGESWQLVTGLPGTRFSQVTFGSDGSMYAWSNGPSSIAQEGLYKSTNGGQNWTNMGPNIGNLFETEIFALTASQTDPNLLFIGGNNFGVNGWESMIYMTTDGGGSWENVYMGPENFSFNYLFVDPNSNDQIIYAAFGGQGDHCGFLQSTDGGESWSDFNAGIPAANKWGGAIVCDPQNSDLLYGGIGGYGNVNGTIFKTIDGGELWTQTSISLGNYSKITDILVSPMNSEVLYVATTQDGVYVSFDAAETWEPASIGLPGTNITGFSNPFILDEIWYFCSSTYSNSVFRTEVYNPGITGVSALGFENDYFQFYPNPSNGEITIKLSDKNTNIGSLSIYTMQGKLLRSFNTAYFSNPMTKLSLILEPNVYICKIVVEGRVYSSKLVIVE